MSLQKKTIKGIKWNVIGTSGSMLIQLIVGIILARILSPIDFGIIGIAYVFIAIARSLIDSGLNQALIQKADATENDYSNVFIFNIAISIIIIIVILISANFIESFFKYDNVSNVLKVISFIILIEAISLIQRTKFIKSIEFKLYSNINIGSKIISGIFGIYLAYKGNGVWSLVYKELLGSALTTIFFWFFKPTKINLFAPWADFKKLFSFGFKIFIADQIENWANQFVSVLIGKKYSAKDLGFYSKAQEFQAPILNIAIGSVNTVAFPSFSKIQDDDIKLKYGYKLIIKTSALIMFPLMLIGILIANELIPLLIGTKWTGCIPYFKLFCIASIFYPFMMFNLNIIKVKGKANLYLNLCLLTKGFLIPAVIIGIQFHIIGLIWAMIVQRIFAAIMNSYHAGKLIDYGVLEQIKDISSKAFFALVIYVIILLFKITMSQIINSSVIIMCLCISLYACLYLFIMITKKDNEFINLIDNIKLALNK